MKINKEELYAIHRILEKLEDEESKYIYIQRLLYSLTGDIKYIYDMTGELGKKHREEILEKSKEAQKMFQLYESMDLHSFLLTNVKKSDGNIIVFGAGYCGANVVYWLRSLGFEPKAFCDNNVDKVGTVIEDCPVIEIQELEREYSHSIIIIASYDYHAEIREQLRKSNVSQELIYEYERNCLLSYWGQPYFEKGIFEPDEEEIFVDAGAFCGETVEEFAQWCPSYKKIYSLEPDYKNFSRLSMNVAQKSLRDVELINAGLWSEDATIYFTRAGDDGTGSYVNDNGEQEIQVVSLDGILQGRPVTYIKMDIEGSEKQALEGAKDTIKKYKPKLAICLYHKPEDVFTLPQYIMQLVPEYKFVIRHYTTFLYDTILYAYVH